jgi:hypothetical protein
VSAFVVVHVAALAWWNLGEIDYVGRDGAVGRFRGAVAVLDAIGVVRDALAGYVRATGLWQSWVLFGPDAPHETGVLELSGIEGFDGTGAPLVDPDPLWTSEDADITVHTQMIGNPPCGWDRSDRPLAIHLRGAWARWHATRLARARGRSYVGAELVCRVRTLPGPDAATDATTTRVELLWAGQLEGAAAR